MSRPQDPELIRHVAARIMKVLEVYDQATAMSGLSLATAHALLSLDLAPGYTAEGAADLFAEQVKRLIPPLRKGMVEVEAGDNPVDNPVEKL